MIYLFIALIAALAVIAFEIHLHYQEKREVLNRFMSGDYQTYRYYLDKYRKDVDVAVKAEEEKLKRKISPEERRAIEEARKF